MKKKENVLHKILLSVIGVLAVILAALLVPAGVRLYEEKVQEKEWQVRNLEVQSELSDIQAQIQELSKDSQALQEFIDQTADQISEASLQDEEVNREQAADAAEVIAEDTAGETAYRPEGSGEAVEASGGTVVSNLDASGEAILVPEPEPVVPQPEPVEIVSENAVVPEAPTEMISENAVSEEAERDKDMAAIQQETLEAISANMVAPEQPEEMISENAVAPEVQETISGNAVVEGNVIPFRYVGSGITLEERRKNKMSFQETLEENVTDKERISSKTIDFSGMTMACLGDSLTAGSNMEKMENYEAYTYPAVMKELLQLKEVYNLGIGGSSFGRYWDNPFVDRYKEIPADTDIILVMGGANDGFAASAKELGTLAEKKKKTFYGDVDELMRGLKQDYPNAVIVFITPLPNVLHDYLMSQRPYLLPQQRFADAIQLLAAEHGIDVIDLYNSNILDTHDAQVISAYMPDGVHGNREGYRVMAEYIASELMNIMEVRQPEGQSAGDETGESVSGSEAVSAQAEVVSGNSVPSVEMPEQTDAEATPSQISEEDKEKAAGSAVVVEPAPAAPTPAPPASPPLADIETPVQETDPVVYGGEAIVVE